MRFTTPLSYLFGGLLIAIILVLSAAGPRSAFAHGGSHAGPVVKQMGKEAALEATLPKSAKSIKKIVAVDQEAVMWAEETYGVRLKKGIYSYFIAQDEQSGETIGGAVVRRSPFRQGRLSLAVGLDAERQVTNVALISINKNYFFELEESISKGIISTYRGMSIAQITNAKELSFSNKTQQQFAVALRDATVLLATLMNSTQQNSDEEVGG